MLGHGQFGQVVKGRYRLAPVAVKRLTNQTASERAAFIKEMAILRACRGSRYIVPFVGALLQKVMLCLVMQPCWRFCGRSPQKTACQESQCVRAQGKVRLPGWPVPMQLVRAQQRCHAAARWKPCHSMPRSIVHRPGAGPHALQRDHSPLRARRDRQRHRGWPQPLPEHGTSIQG